MQEALIEVESLHNDIDFIATITRVQFNDLCMDLFRRTLEPIDDVLKSANVDKSMVDKVILVGGSSRIPKVVELI